MQFAFVASYLSEEGNSLTLDIGYLIESRRDQATLIGSIETRHWNQDPLQVE